MYVVLTHQTCLLFYMHPVLLMDTDRHSDICPVLQQPPWSSLGLSVLLEVLMVVGWEGRVSLVHYPQTCWQTSSY